MLFQETTQLLFILLSTNSLDAWSAILLDGQKGNTQLYIPGNPPTNIRNVNFGLPNLQGQAAVTFNGRAYFIGGKYIESRIITTIFNPSTNRSTSGALLNIGRAQHAATVVNDTIITCGGHNYSGNLSSCEQYTLLTHKWNIITSLPVPVDDFVMVTLNNRVYTFGGSDDCGTSPPTVYMFDGHNWMPRSSIVGLPFYGHAGVSLDNDRVLICGGWAIKDDKCQPVSSCFIYSASSDSWTKAASMAQIRCSHSMVMFKGENCATFSDTCKLQNKYTYSAITMCVVMVQQLNYIHP
jgi:N-acetylneuraminic acid mutarotase